MFSVFFSFETSSSRGEQPQRLQYSSYHECQPFRCYSFFFLFTLRTCFEKCSKGTTNSMQVVKENNICTSILHHNQGVQGVGIEYFTAPITSLYFTLIVTPSLWQSPLQMGQDFFRYTSSISPRGSRLTCPSFSIVSRHPVVKGICISCGVCLVWSEWAAS